MSCYLFFVLCLARTETLRLHNPASHLGRMYTEEITLDLPKGKQVSFAKGDIIHIPSNSIAKDPVYFENPLKFNPDRFSPENGGVKLYMDQEIFFPFGMGSRLCIGSRFALAQGKFCIAAFVKSFELSVNPATKSDLEINPLSQLATISDCYLDFKEIRSLF